MTWDRFLALEPERLIVSLAVLAIMIAVAAFVVLKIREKTLQREPPVSELLSKFAEMHSRGVLNDAEFRTIKTILSEELQKEVRNDGKTA